MSPSPYHTGSQVSPDDEVWWRRQKEVREESIWELHTETGDWGLWELKEAKELTLLWEQDAFPAEVTFELGHLVFCRAAARFCLVWNKHIYKRIVQHIQLDGLDWQIESNSQNDGFVRCLFSENSTCHSPSVNCGKKAVTLSCHSGYGGGAQIMGRSRYFQNSLQPGKIIFQSI